MKRTRDELQEKVTIDYRSLCQEYLKYKDELDHCGAVLIQLTLIEMANENPEITAFSFDAEFVYDDEGSYFWSAGFYEHTPELGPDPIDDGLEEFGGSQAETEIAFEAKGCWEGEITVAKLREIYANQIE